MTKEETIELLEKEKTYMLSHGEDRQAEALDTTIKALDQEHCEDVMVIHAQGLDEGIRCAMCTNSMKSDRGCDGGCVVDENMYREVMNTIRNHIVPLVEPTRKKGKWIKIGDRGFGYSDTVICKCSECEYKAEFTGKFDGLRLVVDMERAYKFCPHCGIEMEV